MAYSKTEWKARQGINLNKFAKSQETDKSVLLTNTPDSITEPGTPFSAENMNHIEEGIADAHTRAAELEANDAVQDSDIAQIWDQINQTKHFRGYYATLAEIQAIQNPEAGDFAYCAEIVAPSTTSNEWIFDGDTSVWIDTGRPIPDQLSPPSDAQPLMDGENPNSGTSNEYSRGDHIHPRHPDIAFVYTDPDTGERYNNEQLYDLIRNVEVDKFEEGKPGTIVGASESDGIGYVKAMPDGKGKVTGLVEMNSLLTMGPPGSNRINLATYTSSFFPKTANVGNVIGSAIFAPANGYISGRWSCNIGNPTLIINGDYSEDNSCTRVSVKTGDRIEISTYNSNNVTLAVDWANWSALNFIYPVINPPAYLEAAPLLDYSTVEQDTGRKWIDGKTIYQKTLSIPTLPGLVSSANISTGVSLPPGLTNIIRNEAFYQASNIYLRWYPNNNILSVLNDTVANYTGSGIIITLWYIK